MRAVVLICTADDRPLVETFDGPSCLDAAHAFAADLRERDDFPGSLIVATGDAEAIEARKARIMLGLGAGA